MRIERRMLPGETPQVESLTHKLENCLRSGSDPTPVIEKIITAFHTMSHIERDRLYMQSLDVIWGFPD